MRKTFMYYSVFIIICLSGHALAQDERGCKIKGMIDRNGVKMYLLPGHYLYDQIQVYPDKGEQWFCSEQEADRAGFMFLPDPNNPQLRPLKSVQAPKPKPTPIPEATSPPAIEDEPFSETPLETEETEQPAEVEPAEAEPAEEPAEEPSEVVDLPQSEAPEEPASTTPMIDIPQKAENPWMESQGSFSFLSGTVAMMVLGISLVIALFFIIVMWKIFTKAGQPGWGVLIPIYNAILALRVAGMPGWWILGFFIPIVNIILSVMLPFKTASCFGKGFLYGLGLLFLPFLFYPHLAFGSAEYIGPQS